MSMVKRFAVGSFAAVLLMGMSSCSQTSELVGSWHTELDVSDMFNSSLTAQLEEDMVPYFSDGEFVLGIDLVFSEDGTYQKSINDEAMTETVDAYKEYMVSAMTSYFEDYLADNGLSMSVEELLIQSDLNLEELADEAMSDTMVNSMKAEFEGKGKYKTEDGKLFLSMGVDYDVDPAVYDTYEFDGETLTLTATYDANGAVEDETITSLYPITFTKVAEAE